ncbi:MAG: protein-L-isoaspartate O-methyltransferase family protein [Egibacteraceae bacterium]
MTDPVQQALDVVDEELFTHRPDGRIVTQTTAARVIADMLRWLDVPPGARVLEIGTGSGFSGALLAQTVGPGGHVVTVDVDAELTGRAATLFEKTGIAEQVTAITGDGVHGAAEHEPYDRIVAWAQASHLPGAWVLQARPGAVIVTPVDLAPLAGHVGGLLRVQVDDEGSVVADGLRKGGFVRMHDEVLTDWLLPPRGVDAHVEREGRVWALSAVWLRVADEGVGDRLLRLAEQASIGPSGERLLEEGESADDLRAWLLATQPEGLTTALLGGMSWHFGASTPDGLAVLGNERELVSAGSPDAGALLTGWIAAWRATGRPGWAHLRPRLVPISRGWHIRAVVDVTPTTRKENE